VEILTVNPNQTKKIAETLAKEILSSPLKNKAFVLALEGDLGGGKTTFLQGFARGLGIKDKILSPTFVLMKRFVIKTKNKPGFREFYHFDCYRIDNPKDILSLDFKKIISNPFNIVAVEWADRIKKILPKDALILKFEFINKTTRKIWLKKNA
jgi:tRNA threonylcarbamoyladenosine biosynthesis protein TsaE